MDVAERFARELAYNAWANREALQSLLDAKAAPPRAAEVMAHIVGAEWLWLRRLGRGTPESAVWPTLSLSDCDTHLRTLSVAWMGFLESLTGESLTREIAYTNTKGERWANTVADVVTHVVLHSSYHRGQIATLLGRAGEGAAHSDYIECVRRGYLRRGWPA